MYSQLDGVLVMIKPSKLIGNTLKINYRYVNEEFSIIKISSTEAFGEARTSDYKNGKHTLKTKRSLFQL